VHTAPAEPAAGQLRAPSSSVSEAAISSVPLGQATRDRQAMLGVRTALPAWWSGSPTSASKVGAVTTPMPGSLSSVDPQAVPRAVSRLSVSGDLRCPSTG
jgi:hypothetical protein